VVCDMILMMFSARVHSLSDEKTMTHFYLFRNT